MYLKDKDLNHLKRMKLGSSTFNNGGIIYYYDDTTLYKIIDKYFFRDDVERNIDFQIKNYIPNTAKIYDKIFIDDEFVGYSMEYIKDTITLKNAIYLSVDFDVIVRVTKDIYRTIKYLHYHNILLGDIHMDNFLIDTKGNGYVIDLDYMTFFGDYFKFHQFYCVKLNHYSNKINVPSKNTDNIKVMIGCLSLLLGINLEKNNIKNYAIDIEDMHHKYIKLLGIEELNKYFIRIINGEEVEYFDDFLMNNYFNFLESGNVRRKKK